MNKNTSHLKWESDHLSDETLRLYSFHQLTKDEARTVELHLVDCEQCTDMTEGYALLQNEKNLSDDLQKLTDKFNNREQKKIPVFYLRPPFYYSVAAVIVVLIGFTFLLKDSTIIQNDKLAELKPKEEVKESKPLPQPASDDSMGINPTSPVSTLTKSAEGKQIAQQQQNGKNAYNYKPTAAFDLNLEEQKFESTAKEAERNSDNNIQSKSEAELPDMAIAGNTMQADNAKNDDATITTTTAPASVPVSGETNDFNSIKDEETKSTEKTTRASSKKQVVSEDKEVSTSSARPEAGVALKNAAPAQNIQITEEDSKAKRESNKSTLFEEGLRLFRNENYNAAKEKFIQSSNSDQNSDALVFLNFIKLITKPDAGNFEFVKAYIGNSNGSYLQDANWALALHYLNQGNKTEAQKLFLKLKDSGGIYKKAAENKLRK